MYGVWLFPQERLTAHYKSLYLNIYLLRLIVVLWHADIVKVDCLLLHRLKFLSFQVRAERSMSLWWPILELISPLPISNQVNPLQLVWGSGASRFLPEASFGLRVSSSPASVCVHQSLACPRDNSSPVQARITKFGPEKQNTLVKNPII